MANVIEVSRELGKWQDKPNLSELKRVVETQGQPWTKILADSISKISVNIVFNDKIEAQRELATLIGALFAQSLIEQIQIPDTIFTELQSYINEIINDGVTDSDPAAPVIPAPPEQIDDEPQPFVSIEQRYGPGGPEYSSSPMFYRFIKRMREQGDIRQVVGDIPFFQYRDQVTGELRDIDPENPGAHAKELLEQISLYMLALLDIEVFQQRSRNVFPNQAWNLDTDEIVSLTVEAGKTGFPYEALINGFPAPVQPYFRYMKSKLMGFSIQYSRAAQMADVADAKTTFETVVTRARTAGGVSGESAGHNKLDIGAIESRSLSAELQEVEQLRDLEGEDPFWDLGDLITIARYEARKSVRETLLPPHINKKKTRGIPVTDVELSQAKRVGNQFPLSLGVGARIDTLRAAITASLERKYRAYLVAKGRKDGGPNAIEFSTREKYMLELAFRHALILFRISNSEIGADSIARDSTFSRGANIREWMKDPSSADRDYFYRHDMDQLFDTLGLTLDEVAHVTAVVPESDFETTDMSFTDYLANISRQYTPEQRAEWARKGFPKEMRRAFGMFPSSVMNPDGTFNNTEARNWVRIFRLKPSARVMQTDEADDIILPLSQVKEGYRLKNGQPEKVIQLSINYETRWNAQLDPKFIDWDSATPSLYAIYSKITDFERRWFEELGQMDKNNVEKVFKQADNPAVKRSLVRLRGVRKDFWQGVLQIAKPLVIAQENLLHNKGGFTDGKISEFAIWMDKTLRGMLGTTVIELDDIVAFGLRSFMQYYVDYFSKELEASASLWSAHVFDSQEDLENARIAAAQVGEEPKIFSPKKVPTMPELRMIFRGIEDSRGVGEGMDSQGLFLPTPLAQGLKLFEDVNGGKLRGINGGRPTETEKKMAQLKANAQIRFTLFWPAFVLALNQYRYRPMAEKHPTLGTTENIATDSPVPITLTYELRQGLMNMFLAFERQIQDSMIKEAEAKGLSATRSDINYAFGVEEMLIQMIRQGIVGYPQQAIEDYRKLHVLAKTRTYSDAEAENKGEERGGKK